MLKTIHSLCPKSKTFGINKQLKVKVFEFRDCGRNTK